MNTRTLMLSAALAALAGPAFAAGACQVFHQSPQLDAAVAAKTLPAVGDRLPKDPLVVQVDEVGTYGGMLKEPFGGGRLADYRHYGYEPLVRWSPDGTQILPNIASSWEVSEDAKSYTFHIRAGLKWSDGVPFSADDIVFWWDRVENNRAVSPKGPYRTFTVENEVAKVEKIDDLTVRISWSKPNGRFLLDLAGPYGQRVVQFPAHYVRQFDKELNPDGVAQMMAASGEKDYAKWWAGRVGTYGQLSEQNDPKRPTMLAWRTVEPVLGKTHFVLERNPYYFKVDQSCNQLPYIDARSYDLAKDSEVQLLKTMAGDFDYSLPGVSVPQNKGVFFENQQKGNYRFAKAESCDYNTMFIELPFNSPKTWQQSFFQNKDVRIALSIAIDRPGIIDTVYLGQGEPYQAAPRPGSPYFNERLAKQYTEFDPAKANALLDKYYPKKDAQGFRLTEDGQRVSFTISAEGGFRAEWGDVLQIIAQNWADIGVEMKPDIASGEVYETRRKARDREGLVWAGENGCGQLPLSSLARMIRYQSNWDNWINWIDKNIAPQTETVAGAEPIEPPQDIKDLFRMEAEIPTKTGKASDELVKKFMDQMADSFVNIGTVLPEGNYRVVSNRLGGVHEPIIEGWLYPGPAPSNMEAWFVKK